MKNVCPVFSSNRMLAEYTSKFYVPAYKGTRILSEDNYSGARQLAAWMEKVRDNWHSVAIDSVQSDIENGTCAVGDPLPVTVALRSPGLEPDDLLVEVQHGKIEHDGWLTNRESVRLKFDHEDDGRLFFTGLFECTHSGNQGFTVRILPCHKEFGRIIEPNLVCWWE